MKEMSTEIEKIKEKNVGKWIAVKNGKIVSLSTDFNVLMETLKNKKVKKGVYVFYSPTLEEKRRGFFFRNFWS